MAAAEAGMLMTGIKNMKIEQFEGDNKRSGFIKVNLEEEKDFLKGKFVIIKLPGGQEICIHLSTRTDTIVSFSNEYKVFDSFYIAKNSTKMVWYDSENS